MEDDDSDVSKAARGTWTGARYARSSVERAIELSEGDEWRGKVSSKHNATTATPYAAVAHSPSRPESRRGRARTPPSSRAPSRPPLRSPRPRRITSIAAPCRIFSSRVWGTTRRSGRLTRRALRGCTIPHEPTRRHTELTRAPRAPSRHRTMHVARAIGRAARCVRLRSAGCGRASTGFATAAATARPVVEVAVPSISVEDGGTSSTFPVRRVYCVGKNYAKHTIEMGGDPKKDPPCFFSKPSDAVNQLQFVQYPPMSADVQYEVRHAMRRCAGNRAQV